MRRILSFDVEDRVSVRRFELVYEGLLVGSAVTQGRGDRKTREMEARILHWLEELAVDKINEDLRPYGLVTGDPMRTLGKSGSMMLSNAEVELIVKYIDAVGWKIKLAAEVNDLVDYLEDLPKEERVGRTS